MRLKSPYPYFGGKSAIANEIWKRFGNPSNFIDPFFGSGAVLLARPHRGDLELVNDIHGYIVNFWRAVQSDADAVALYADYPAFESDLHARHAWLTQRKDDLQARLEGDPEWYDAKIAGWWVWGMSLWLGGSFCSGRGPWMPVGGRLVKTRATGEGISRGRPHLTDWHGIMRKSSGLSHGSERFSASRDGLVAYMRALQTRFARVRVMCGDWTRAVTPALLKAKLPAAVLLDPPYAHDGRATRLYASDVPGVHLAAREWALINGNNPQLRIAYCGYDDGFSFPDGWTCLRWKAHGGYANQGEKRRGNSSREVVWFSPFCLNGAWQMRMFETSSERNENGHHGQAVGIFSDGD